MYHDDRHNSDTVHEDDDFRNRICSSPVKDQGDWQKIMSIGFAALRLLYLCTVLPFVGSNDTIQRLDYI